MNTSSEQTTLTKSLKPGVNKTKYVDLILEGETTGVPVSFLCEGVPELSCSIKIPYAARMMASEIDSEKYADLLLGGQLSFMQSKQAKTSLEFTNMISKLVQLYKLVEVQCQGKTSSLYGETKEGFKLAFLIKEVQPGQITLEGRGENKDTLFGILDDIALNLKE